MAAKDVKETLKETEAKVTETVNEVKKTAAAKTESARRAAKTVAKKTEVVAKDAKEKAAKTAKKTASKVAAKTVAANTQVVFQFSNREADMNTVVENVKAAFIAEGHKASEIKKVNVYVKPEDYSVYYVINDSFSGRIDLF